MTPLTITLTPALYAQVASGEKRVISTQRNPRKDRYFAAKSPDTAKINGYLYPIYKIEGTDTEWKIFIQNRVEDARRCKHPPARLYSWCGKDALGAFTAVVCFLCGSVLHC